VKKICGINIFVLFMVLVFIAEAHADQVRVSVAKSLSNLCNNLIVKFQAQHPDVKIVPNFCVSWRFGKANRAGGACRYLYFCQPEVDDIFD
jgi:hypothetical protein